MAEKRDEFLSEEDLDLKNFSFEELIRVWNLWLEVAQSTNDADDEYEYSHGVFRDGPKAGIVRLTRTLHEIDPAGRLPGSPRCSSLMGLYLLTLAPRARTLAPPDAASRGRKVEISRSTTIYAGRNISGSPFMNSPGLSGASR
jgi:hypothetical protein